MNLEIEQWKGQLNAKISKHNKYSTLNAVYASYIYTRTVSDKQESMVTIEKPYKQRKIIFKKSYEAKVLILTSNHEIQTLKIRCNLKSIWFTKINVSRG